MRYRMKKSDVKRFKEMVKTLLCEDIVEDGIYEVIREKDYEIIVVNGKPSFLVFKDVVLPTLLNCEKYRRRVVVDMLSLIHI